MALLKLLEHTSKDRAEAMGFDTSRVLYHGSRHSRDEFNGLVWFSVSPRLASSYSGAPADSDWEPDFSKLKSHIKPCYIRKGLKVFNADKLSDYAVTVQSFMDELISQGAYVADLEETVSMLKTYARREESGPSYNEHDFWYASHYLFGNDGATLLAKVWRESGFDAISFTEDGHPTIGVFRPQLDVRGIFAKFQNPEGGLMETAAPKIWYHGTPRRFDSFREPSERRPKTDLLGAGIYLTSDMEAAKLYAGPRGFILTCNVAPGPILDLQPFRSGGPLAPEQFSLLYKGYRSWLSETDMTPMDEPNFRTYWGNQRDERSRAMVMAKCLKAAGIVGGYDETSGTPGELVVFKPEYITIVGKARA